MLLPGPGCDEGGHSVRGLEHLDERDAKIEIGEVATDQAETEEKANGHDRFPA